MKIPRLTVIPAGAGSGKTYRIQKQLADWVGRGLVAPDRILAVTFTEAAASELKERIRFELIARDRIEDALALEESYISTIHAFGLRLLCEFAFEAGISPLPRLLDEDEQGFLIRRALARTAKADPVAADLRKYGYRFDRATKAGPEEVFLETLLSLIGLLRSLGRRGEDPGLIGEAGAFLRREYGPTDRAEALDDALHGAVCALLRRFPRDLSPDFEGNKSAVRDFRENFRNLRRAEDRAELSSDWELWASLRRLRVSAKGKQVPPGYKGCAEEVMKAAAALSRHPGPLADAQLHVSALLGASQECLGAYGEEKRRASLVDYPDMLALAHDLLSKRPDVLRIVRDRLDCLVIDEFQDTNPLQFALLWKIHACGVPALIVGDVKQSIMGFQNADPRLFRRVMKAHPRACAPLTENWRTSAPLMEWVNAVAQGLFGDEYAPLSPRAGFRSAMEPLEAVAAPRHIRSNAARASWTAVRIKELLEDPDCAVWDKAGTAFRRVRGGDVAVLCPTNKLVATYAGVLRTLGIRTRIERDGWLGSPAVQVLYHALAYLADPEDRHAALCLSVTELGVHTLESALSALRRGERPADAVLEALDGLRAVAAERTVEDVVAGVIEALDLYGKAARWPDAAGARADLVRFQEEARRFREANRRVLLAGGYYGGGIKTFLSWLAARAEENDRRPDPRVVDEDAVTLTTWHSAKGLEWPVVAVCGVHRTIEPRLPHVSVAYADFDDLGDVLAKARVEIVPAFAAEETNVRFRERLRPALEEEAKRLLYVALTRAREKLILEWPGHLAGKDRSYYWTLLASAAGIELFDASMRVGGREFPCIVRTAGTGIAPEVEDSDAVAVEPLAEFGRRAIELRSLPAGFTPESVAPSALRAEPVPGGPAGLTEETIGPAPEVDVAVAAADRGILLHRCFEVAGGRAERLDLIARAAGLDPGEEAARRLSEAVSQFDGWVARRFRPLRVLREVPLLGLDARGSVVSGVVDLLVETEAGYWIIDHKSDAAEDRAARFAVYVPQLRAYADLVRGAFRGRPVLGVGIHWILHGKATLLPVTRGL